MLGRFIAGARRDLDPGCLCKFVEVLLLASWWGMAYKIQFTDTNGKMVTEPFETATNALARASEIHASLPPPTLLHILDQEERDLTLEDLEKLAKKE